MGGYLTIPTSDSEHEYMNWFLDTHVGEPMEFIAAGDDTGTASWTAFLSVTDHSWDAVQCQLFHICERYDVS